MTNNALLEQTMQQILDHPELHKQSWWFTETDCGTAACFAGWACILSGYTPQLEDSHGHVRRGEYVAEGRRDVHNLAVELLGLTDDEAETLFDAFNSREVLQLMVKDLANGTLLRDRPSYVSEAHL